MLCIPASDAADATASTEVTAGVRSVSVQLQRCLTHRILKHRLIFIEQTAHDLGVSTSFSASETGIQVPSVVRIQSLVNLVHYILHWHFHQ